MTLEKLLELCRSYRDLGDAVADQLDEVLDDIDRNFLREVVRCGDEELALEATDLRVQLKERGL